MTHPNGLPPPSSLSGHHKRTWEAIFRHPVAHNLEWHDVRSLLGAVADVTENHSGHLQVTRGGHTMTLHKPKHKDVARAEEVLAIRRFLEQSSEAAGQASLAPGVHLLVVIDHREARIYRSFMRGAVPERIEPYDPHGFLHHLRKEVPETAGRREPERHSFYEAIAETLRGADDILVLGSGTGRSNAMDQLLADLREHHRDVAEHIIGSTVVDEHRLTEGELLAVAREFFASNKR